MLKTSNADIDSTEQTNSVIFDLPPCPIEPPEEACCGQGCTPCIKDIYDQELRLWQKECDNIRRGKEAELSVGIISVDHYTKFELSDIRSEGSSCWRYRFKLPDGTNLQLLLAQHLVLRDRERNIVRQYSPVTDGSDQGYFEVIIKIYPEGQMSQYVKTWEIGQCIEWRGPLGGVSYKANSHKHIMLLAAGTGLAPMLSVMRRVLENEDDYTRLVLFYACKNYSDIICKDELDGYTSYWNFKVNYFLSQELSRNVRYGDKVVHERINEEFITKEIENYTTTDVFSYICGTKDFDTKMMAILRNLQFSEHQWHKF